LRTQQSAPSQTVGTQGRVQSTPQEERMVDFVDAVANDVQGMWGQTLGGRYERTHVVLFRDSIESACGAAESATGPFYCPSDGKVYLDVGFFDELTRRFGAPGDFAKAYVIAHELGHHVQHLLDLDAGARRGAATGPNSASVALELQADCLAGVWGHTASQSGRFKAGHVELDAGDAEQALHAAAAIGDDRLQKMTTGHAMPDRFTHGTSARRVDSFRRGMDTGDLRTCGAAAHATQ
jgi:predicted metalloprotease